MITIADEYLSGFLKIDVMSGALKELLLRDNIFFPEFDSLFLVLDCEENTVLVECLTRVVILTLEVNNIIVKELTSNICIEFCKPKGANGRILGRLVVAVFEELELEFMACLAWLFFLEDSQIELLISLVILLEI